MVKRSSSAAWFGLQSSVLALTLAASGCTASVTDSGPAGAGGAAGGSTSSVGGGGGGSAPIPPGAGRVKLGGAPKYYRVVRLTNQQWTNSAQSVLGLASPPTIAETFQNAVPGLNDFTNNELLLDIDPRGWSDYAAAAEALAAQVTADPAQLSKLYPGTDGPGFIAAVGRRVYRRPLTAVETASYQKLFDMGPTFSGTQSAFAKGASVVLEAMLQSPYFLYRTELGAAGAPLSAYEMAAKLSLWLRTSTPDDALLDAAAGPGQLDTPAGAAALAQKMLEEPSARAVMRSFHGQFLHFGKFAELTKVGVESYPPATSAELGESSYLFFDRIFSQGLGVKDIFLSTTGFVGPNMAQFYEGGLAAPASGFVERELGSNRLGFFMQLPFLMLYARPDGPDPIHRGASMSLDVLCAPLGTFGGELPPLPPRMAGETNRMRVDSHTKVCGAACHNNMINPLGFAFENFDGMGQYRETELNGTTALPIDASGSFEFVGGVKSYQNAADLMKVIAADPQAHLCYSKKLASFALQRDIVEGDLPLLAQLSAVSTSSSGSIKQLMVDLVKQDAFRIRAEGAK
jgi:Protein of unknown function (DUF1592)/Protein of unknown function (DUF1588)/Protein of unknown function (DUF1595)/Protein of unknown function (DUF1585)/Protein of unknown function (DUF1587)